MITGRSPAWSSIREQELCKLTQPLAWRPKQHMVQASYGPSSDH